MDSGHCSIKYNTNLLNRGGAVGQGDWKVVGWMVYNSDFIVLRISLNASKPKCLAAYHGLFRFIPSGQGNQCQEADRALGNIVGLGN